MATKKRYRKKPAMIFKDRLVAFAKRARNKALRLPAGAERDDLIRRARDADMAALLDEWINSPGLQPPK